MSEASSQHAIGWICWHCGVRNLAGANVCRECEATTAGHDTRSGNANMYRGAGWTLIEGDCLEAMKQLQENSIDSVVTDPPYGLGEVPDMTAVLTAWLAGEAFTPQGRGFMGKVWDAFVPGPNVWREVFRVLKPGGHLLTFGGSRTFDLVGLAVRLAGFEIRDTLSWNYGTGFPKSLDIARTMAEKGLLCECQNRDTVRSVRQAPDDLAGMVEACQGADLLPTMQRDSSRTGMGEARSQGEGRLGSRLATKASREDARPDESSLEGRSDSEAGERELQGRSLRAMPSGVPSDGAAGRVRDGAPSRDGSEARPLPDPDRGCSPSRPRSTKQHSNESGTLPGQRHAQTCGGCGKTRREFIEGRGTALKPAWEPVIMARKPLSGTVAANVQQWGTGALNIDGCRIAGMKPQVTQGINSSPTSFAVARERRLSGDPNIGRWPANVVLDDEAAAALDAQTGTMRARGNKTPTKRGAYNATSFQIVGNDGKIDPGDSGGASRFFYVAKASRSERDAGCEALLARSAGEATDRQDDTVGLSSPRAGAGRTGGARNIHPTVKPVELMRWLVRLVTPPGGYVFDPFAGSGTTGIAALQEGFMFGGCEREVEYAQIAIHRLAYATKKP